jgi:hypothetical protein
LILAFLCAVLLIAFKGVTDRLIPLFAVGAFLAFTMSQAGMVAHWYRERGKHWKTSLAVNALGAVSTAIALSIILVAKFVEGAWIVVLLIPTFVIIFASIRRHYLWVQTKIEHTRPAKVISTTEPIVILPVKGWTLVSEAALQFALSISKEITALHIAEEDEHGAVVQSQWRELVEDPLVKAGKPKVALKVIVSPFRKTTTPILDEVIKVRDAHPNRTIAVIIPELVEQAWYQYPLHNQRANFIKALLLFRGGKNIVVINVPWYLAERTDASDTPKIDED